MTTKVHLYRIAALAAGVALLSPGVFAQEPVAQTPVAGKSADNTKTNVRDRSSETMKPTDQPNNRVDLKLAAAVRRAIVHDKGLSRMAHNVKLVAASGAVTLRGPVANDTEKARVEELAAGVAGVTHVDNQLDVKH